MKKIIFTLLLLSSCGPPPRFDEVCQSEKHSYKGKILIDPGHGGDDCGTEAGEKQKYREKNLTLSTSRQLKKNLQQLGYQVILSRDSDIFISLADRVQLSQDEMPDLFVSIHFNSAPNPSAQGIEVYYYRAIQERAPASRKLAEEILNSVVKKTGAKSRGVKHGNFAVIRDTAVPAVLIEGGFLTNREELNKIKESNYMKKLSIGIAQGIDSFMHQLHDKKSV